MKLVVFCLFAVCCTSLASTTANRKFERKLQEILRLVDTVKKQQHTKLDLHTPPQNIEDCCCLSALKCFQANMGVHFNISEKYQGKLYSSLNHTLTVNGLTLNNSRNTECTCGDCDLHPKTNATVFFSRLRTFIEKGLTRLGTV
ncbi:interleukin-21 [Epinephelus moara]|uniref:interleukin-21 n=1 Tax=Epinephelus moara TaxID=300413 RepID=UPI00214DFD9D|nr:interleukin-21 [Epinephelus moara]